MTVQAVSLSGQQRGWYEQAVAQIDVDRLRELIVDMTGIASPTGQEAELAGYVYFQLVEIGSTDPVEAKANAAGAARAFQIAVKEHHELSALSNLAAFQYFNGELAVGDRTAREAAKEVPKSQAWVVEEQLGEERKRAEKFLSRVKRGAEELEETAKLAILTHNLPVRLLSREIIADLDATFTLR